VHWLCGAGLPASPSIEAVALLVHWDRIVRVGPRRYRAASAHAAAASALSLAMLGIVAALTGVSAAERLLDSTKTSPAQYRERLNDQVVTIMAGTPSATGLTIAHDLAEVLDDGETLRVVPIVGRGVAQNVRDVRFMRGVDMGITHANILKYFARTGELGPNIASQITYVAKLFNEEVHVIAGPEIGGIEELDGRVVNFGEEGSGADITAELILDALNIDVQTVHLGFAEAIIKIRAGEIAAAIMVGGKPAPMMSGLEAKGLKLLSIPYSKELEEDYYPATLSHHDYPEFIAPGDSVDTVAVCSVLVTFNWAEGSERYRKVEKFVDAFFSKFDEFHRPPRHPKWREVNFAATLEGWTRSPISQRWIDRAAEESGVTSRTQFDEFLRQTVPGNNGPMSAAERAQLFRAFVEWNSKRRESSPGSD
jgi:TRAP transporter TAXI family solute receptor